MIPEFKGHKMKQRMKKMTEWKKDINKNILRNVNGEMERSEKRKGEGSLWREME